MKPALRGLLLGAAICPRCRREIVYSTGTWDADANACRECAGTSLKPPSTAPQEAKVPSVPTEPRPSESGGRAAAAPPVADTRGSEVFLTVVGVLLCIVGLYYLFNPGIAIDQSSLGGFGAALPSDVVNL